jgi:hypothetical protein
LLGASATSRRESRNEATRSAGASGDAIATDHVQHEHSEHSRGDAAQSSIIPMDFSRALAAFARHESAVRRHAEVITRLRLANRESDDLRARMVRLREHNACAASEMRDLRDAVARYTQVLRDSGLPPERTLVVIRKSVGETVAGLPAVERPRDVSSLASDLVQCAIQAYYAA